MTHFAKPFGEPRAGRWMPTRAGVWSSNGRPGQGKSKGYRTIILLREGHRAFFVYGFAKSDRANIREGENEQFRKMARHVLGLSDTQLNILIGKGQFEEVESDGEEVSK